MQIKTETKVGIFVLGAIIVFFYMNLRIGVFRLDRSNYKNYTIYFKDVSGLSKKAEVKIAGVKVGWVEDLELIDFEETQAKADIMLQKKYILHSNAYAVVRREGLIGATYLEIIPGDPLLPELPEGASLSKPSVAPTSMDELMQQFGRIADNIEGVTKSMKSALGGPNGKEQMQDIVDNFHLASEKFAEFTETMDKTLSKNEENISNTLNDLKTFANDLKESMPDIKRIADKTQNTAESIEEASIEVRDGFKSIGSIANKIDSGKGMVGKLINEEDSYRDLKVAVQGLKNYFNKIDSLELVVDSHFEAMYRNAEFYNHEDAKGYLDIRLYPSDDRFYLIQFIGTQKGNIKRFVINKDKTWKTEDGQLLDPDSLEKPRDKFRFSPKKEKIETVKMRDTMKFGLQFGKTFKDIAFRFGIFESSFGVGIDYDIPFNTDKFRWVTTLEGFDFRGRDRIDDNRPHLKWLNRVFLFRNIYLSFGADDFISKRNANGFFGLGLRFGDNDLKYLASKVNVPKF